MAPEVLERLLQSKPAYADVFFHSILESVVDAQSSLRGSRFGPARFTQHATRIEGVGLRVIDGARTGFAATADLSRDGLQRAMASSGLVPGENASDLRPEVRDAPLRQDEALVDEVRTLLDTCLGASEKVESATVRISRIQIHRAVAAHESTYQQDQTSRFELRVSLVACGQKISITRTFLGNRSEMDDTLRAIARAVVSKIDLIEIERAAFDPPLPVVLGPGWGAVWLHEAVGHQLEADSVSTGQSSLSDWSGRQIASESVSIVDSPLVDSRVSQTFDDEGVPSKETALIDRGTIVGLLSDRFASITYGLPLTGNGRRAHYAQIPRPRMTNLMLRPGSQSPASLIGSVRRGVYVSDIRHAWFEPQSGQVHLDVVESALIEDGELTEAISPFKLAATPRSLLNGITAIADDFALETDRGYCMKGGAAIPVGVGQPTVLIDSFNLSA